MPGPLALPPWASPELSPLQLCSASSLAGPRSPCGMTFAKSPFALGRPGKSSRGRWVEVCCHSQLCRVTHQSQTLAQNHNPVGGGPVRLHCSVLVPCVCHHPRAAGVLAAGWAPGLTSVSPWSPGARAPLSLCSHHARSARGQTQVDGNHPTPCWGASSSHRGCGRREGPVLATCRSSSWGELGFHPGPLRPQRQNPVQAGRVTGEFWGLCGGRVGGGFPFSARWLL